MADKENPALFAFLPLHHIVVVETANILPYLEDYPIAAAGAADPM